MWVYFFLPKASLRGAFSDPQHTHPAISYWSPPLPLPLPPPGIAHQPVLVSSQLRAAHTIELTHLLKIAYHGVEKAETQKK